MLLIATTPTLAMQSLTMIQLAQYAAELQATNDGNLELAQVESPEEKVLQNFLASDSMFVDATQDNTNAQARGLVKPSVSCTRESSAQECEFIDENFVAFLDDKYQLGGAGK